MRLRIVVLAMYACTWATLSGIASSGGLIPLLRWTFEGDDELAMKECAVIAAPGVMGGVLMASVGLVESILGFDAQHCALLMTLYLALDGYGPAANVTGDGAIALAMDRFFELDGMDVK